MINKRWQTLLITIRRGSFKTCYVQKHGTEIIEVEVWPYIATFSERESVKVINVLWSMGTNVQYTSRNTNLAAF